MRYGTPSIGDRLKKLSEDGHDRILIVPLYPQYSAATTATAVDKAGDALTRDAAAAGDPDSAALLRSSGVHHGSRGKRASPPRRAGLEAGEDPGVFSRGAAKPTLTRAIPTIGNVWRRPGCWLANWDLRTANAFGVVFQSRFGRAEWLQPYAVDTVSELARSGLRNLVMVCPGFAADCVETLEEVAIGLAETFAADGGVNFSLVPALNDSPQSLDMLSRLIRQELQGWL